ncbi:MAG TPA: hypothetical protein VM345_18975 [Acidimicrobiales bacterium]|nr:hypothetical protein [Acidimicrobiales bacterium]
MSPAAGIDVGGDRLHVVVVDDEARVVHAVVARPDDTASVVDLLLGADAQRVAIDSPDAPSTLPHAGDVDLSPKFRQARCGEIALGRQQRLWVSWVTPNEGPFPRWMEAGFAMFEAVRDAGIDAIEVYPHAVYRVLAGARLPSKLGAAGIAARAQVLRAAGIDGGPHLEMWSHDGLDAAAAAYVAADLDAVAVTCGHDGSAIWIPGRSVACGLDGTVAP